MTDLVRLEKKLIAKGFNNVEVTKDGKKYYVLHISKNNVPVPFFCSTDRKQLLEYLDLHYGVKEK